MRAILYAVVRAVLLSTLAVAGTFAAEAPQDVQRLQRERERQQLELRLKMQQQQDRAPRPASDVAGAIERQTLERDQQQRQQQTHERAAREAIAPGSEEGAGIQRAREAQAAADELQRLDAQRRSAAERVPHDRVNLDAPLGP